MKNLTEIIIGAIIAGLPILFKSFTRELIENITNKFFDNKFNEKTISKILTTTISIFILFGVLVMFYSNIFEKKTTIVQEEQLKSDAEVAFEARKEVVKIAKEISNTSKKNSTVKIANIENQFVYQIGGIMEKDAVLDLYVKLKSFTTIDLSKIFLFKLSENKYSIFIDDGGIPNDTLINWKTQIRKFEKFGFTIDFMKSCKLRERIIEVEELLIFKKEKVKIRCFTCDK